MWYKHDFDNTAKAMIASGSDPYDYSAIMDWLYSIPGLVEETTENLVKYWEKDRLIWMEDDPEDDYEAHTDWT